MTLGEVIDALKALPPDMLFARGFDTPHSYRGYYDQLAFEPATAVTVEEMLTDARSALGATFEGYKGGTYVMESFTDVWLAEWGRCGEALTPDFFRAAAAEERARGLEEALRELCERLDRWWFEADPDAGYDDGVKRGDPHPWTAAARAALAPDAEGGRNG